MICKYKVSYYDDYNDKELFDEGLVWGETYGKAADNVTADYGRDIISLYLEDVEADDSFCINKEEINYSFKTN